MKRIKVHHLSENPTAAWNEISKQQKVFKLNVKLPTKSQTEEQVRFVCMSDTHAMIHNIKFDIPEGDVFLHAGDFSKCGHIDEILSFNSWLGTLPHKYKIVICGNHELTFDPQFSNAYKDRYEQSLSRRRTSIDIGEAPVNYKKHLTNCIYLEDSSVELYGIKIYGTPWQPAFWDWAFNLKRGSECLEKWDLIPEDTDILITHAPPLGHGDLVCDGVRAGCVELLATVQERVKPKYHVFGHIHEGYGVSSDGKIIYINASTCDVNYLPNNPPIVFDFPIPKDYKSP